MSDSVAAQVKKVVAYIRKQRPRRADVIVGPVTPRPRTLEPYFVFVHESKHDAHIMAMNFGDDPNMALTVRAELIAALRAAKPPIVTHDFEDELAVVQMAEAIWPSPKTHQLHEDVKAERAQQLAAERKEMGVDSVMEERRLTAAEITTFGLSTEDAENIHAIDGQDHDTGELRTIYFRLVAVEVEGEMIMVPQAYFPP